MRRWVWLLGVLVLLLGAHAAYWRIVSARLAAGYDAWAAAQRAAGWTVNSGTPVIGGWPLAATLTLPEVFIAAPHPTPAAGLAGDLTWSTDHLTLRVALLRPTLLEVLSTGLQRLRLGEGPEIPYTADVLRIDIPLDPDGPATVDLVGNDLRIGLPVAPGAAASAEADPVAGLTIGLLKGHADLPAAPLPVGFLLAAEAVGLPPRALPAVTDGLGSRISSVSIEGSLTGPWPGVADPAAQARAWRVAGGALRIGRLALGWGPLGLSLTARLTLDGELQPAGTGEAHVIGFARTLDALAASHAIGTHAALAGKALLGLIAQPAGGQTDAVDLPLTVQDRMLSIRTVPLLRLPALEWD
jgi:hypothetical protein